jgi:hypothetical protein
LKRVTGALLLAALLDLPVAGGAGTAEIECAWSGIERVVAVGDVHGDHAQFVKALRAAKVIDAEENWTAGKTHLVQLGDVLDRGPDSRKAMDLLMKLEGQAAKAGGRVHALVGNHEAMILSGYYFYLHPREPDAFGGLQEFRKALGPDGTYGRWICGHNAVIKIDDVLFVHGGISPEYASRSLRDINDAVRKELEGKAKAEVTEDPAGPLWYRGLAESDEAELEKRLEPVLKAYGAARIVVGHTVTKGEITPRAGGSVLMIDVGMSRVYEGPPACLLIEKGKFFQVSPEETREIPVRPPGKPGSFRWLHPLAPFAVAG